MLIYLNFPENSVKNSLNFSLICFIPEYTKGVKHIPSYPIGSGIIIIPIVVSGVIRFVGGHDQGRKARACCYIFFFISGITHALYGARQGASFITTRLSPSSSFSSVYALQSTASISLSAPIEYSTT